MTNNLSVTQLTTNQDNKETTINDANGELDAAITATITKTIDNTNAGTVTQAELQRAASILVADDGASPPTAGITLTFASFERGNFVVVNTSAQAVTVTISGQTETAPVLAAGETFTLNMTGGNIRSAGGGSGGGGSSTLLGLTDTPGSFTGQSGRVLKVNVGEDAMEFADDDNTGGGSGTTIVGPTVSTLLPPFRVAPPDPADFATVLNSPTVTQPDTITTNLSGAADASLVRARLTTVPVGDFTIDARLRSDAASTFNGGGIVLRDTLGAITMFGFVFATPLSVEVGEWTDQTTFSAGQGTISDEDGDYEYFRITVVGSTITYLASKDGLVYDTIHTDSFLGTLQDYGFGVGNRNAVTATEIDVTLWIDGNNDGNEIAVFAAPTSVSLNTQTASYTLALEDAGANVRMNVAGANNLTVPPNSTVAFPTGTVISARQVGAGQTTIVAGAGVTINTPETLLCRKQGSTVSLVKVGTDEWDLTGDLQLA
ncbi:gp87 [Alphaproteobacteria phage PhiJL001]|uniref:Gp87 n=1 Tax=Alphaproteobacteria phage PhiJL001 TaxID=2681607 RepID=Q5DN18_9CAUD|nr:virion structural protein [Alphaproteobacteria phage PhiJL001]AAT69482.1 gp87 [Alphaproteobacteria phage PhiJL001]